EPPRGGPGLKEEELYETPVTAIGEPLRASDAELLADAVEIHAGGAWALTTHAVAVDLEHAEPELVRFRLFPAAHEAVFFFGEDPRQLELRRGVLGAERPENRIGEHNVAHEQCRNESLERIALVPERARQTLQDRMRIRARHPQQRARLALLRLVRHRAHQGITAPVRSSVKTTAFCPVGSGTSVAGELSVVRSTPGTSSIALKSRAATTVPSCSPSTLRPATGSRAK